MERVEKLHQETWNNLKSVISLRVDASIQKFNCLRKNVVFIFIYQRAYPKNMFKGNVSYVSEVQPRGPPGTFTRQGRNQNFEVTFL